LIFSLIKSSPLIPPPNLLEDDGENVFSLYLSSLHNSPQNWTQLISLLTDVVSDSGHTEEEKTNALLLLPSLLVLSMEYSAFVSLSERHSENYIDIHSGRKTISGFKEWRQEDPLWLGYEVMKSLQEDILLGEGLTDLDRECLTLYELKTTSSQTEASQTSLQSRCCPDPTNPALRNPHLPTKFLTTLLDSNSQLGVFLDEVGGFSYSLSQFGGVGQLCGPEGERESGMAARTALATPSLYDSRESMEEGRRQLLMRIEGHRGQTKTKLTPTSLDSTWTTTPPTFLIGYQGLGDAETLRKISEVYSSSNKGEHVDFVSSDREGGNDCVDKIHVGFASSFLWGHSVGRLIAGVILRLSEEKFCVHVFILGGSFGSAENANDNLDSVQLAVRKRADRFKILPGDVASAAAVVRNSGLDVLIYPEIGMDTATYHLAHHRLAQVQCVFWGHPMSQGISTIDYFITGDLFEEGGGREIVYEEQSLRLEGLTANFKRPTVPNYTEEDRKRNKEEFGFGDKNVYFCPQTLMKFHIDFDDVLLGILRKDEAAVIVVTYNTNQILWKETLMKRMCDGGVERKVDGFVYVAESESEDTGFESGVSNRCIDNGRIVFLPSMEKQKFYKLLNAADVLLDPFPWGGGVTALEGFASGGVIVTLPGNQHVVRLARGMYELMGFKKGGAEGVIVNTVEEYINEALAFAENGGENEKRRMVKEKIKENLNELFDEERLKESMSDWERMIVQLSQSQHQ